MAAFNKSTQNELNRREFLRLALAASAALAASGRAHAAGEATPASLAHAALHPLPPGAVEPEGWLRGWMQKQAAQLGSQLPQVSWPFSAAYWSGEENVDGVPPGTTDAWWPWEQKAYWLDGATRLSIVLKDEQLMALVRQSLDYTLSHARDDGYLGPENFRNPKGDFHRWPQNVLFRGMAALADARSIPGSPETTNVAEALRQHFLGDTADYGSPTRNVTNIEGMIWCYGKTGDARLLTMAEEAWKSYQKNVADDAGHGDLGALRVFAATPINSHGCTYAETMKLPAILYLATGKPEYLEFAQAAERRIFDHHMLVSGIPSTTEWYRTVTSLDAHETCDITDHTWSWGYMLMATGDSVWADRVERACYNAAPGAIKNDWKALQYFSCPNQFLATLNSDHTMMSTGSRMMAYQPNPGQRTACCGANVHRMLPNFAIRMWMKTNDNGLAAVLYGPSRVRATVGADNQPVSIVQSTHYPFEEQIRLSIETEKPVTFPLLLRAPGWCATPRVTLNGAEVKVERNDDGFLRIERTFKPGDKITLTFPMQARVTNWPQDGVAVEHGPLVYTLPIKANWTSKVEPKFTTAEFPSWEATPVSAWNYGLDLDAAKPEASVEFSRKPLAVDGALDPWVDPPTSITVPALLIAGWELQTSPDDPNQKFTPPLPDVSARKTEGPSTRITLVPYGATELRLTIFPALRT
jgi:hypothetical protein